MYGLCIHFVWDFSANLVWTSTEASAVVFIAIDLNIAINAFLVATFLGDH